MTARRGIPATVSACISGSCFRRKQSTTDAPVPRCSCGWLHNYRKALQRLSATRRPKTALSADLIGSSATWSLDYCVKSIDAIDIEAIAADGEQVGVPLSGREPVGSQHRAHRPRAFIGKIVPSGIRDNSHHRIRPDVVYKLRIREQHAQARRVVKAALGNRPEKRDLACPRHASVRGLALPFEHFHQQRAQTALKLDLRSFAHVLNLVSDVLDIQLGELSSAQ